MAEGKKCEWCDATDNLVVGMVGDPLKPIWVCANQHDCKARIEETS